LPRLPHPQLLSMKMVGFQQHGDMRWDLPDCSYHFDVNAGFWARLFGDTRNKLCHLSTNNTSVEHELVP
jgi:hypothetical protein